MTASEQARAESGDAESEAGTGYDVTVAGAELDPGAGWTVTWVDPERGVVRVGDAERWVHAAVDGQGSEWVVTLHGRRIPVTVRTRRERLLAAEKGAASAAGPIELKATLPGLVVAVAVGEGDEVGDGQPVVTIEAMKMHNEVRAPRAGRVTRVSVGAGQTVRSGEPLLRIE